MADLMQFNQNNNDPPTFSRPFINERKFPDVANLKKRKLFVGVAEDLGLPAPKHKCCEAIVGSECDLLSVKDFDEEDAYTSMKDGLDAVSAQHSQVSAARGCNSPADAQSVSTDVKFDSGFENANSYDNASTSWAISGSRRSQSSLFQVQSSSIEYGKDVVEEEECLQQDTSWHDIDCLDECIGAQCIKGSCEQTADGFDEFLTSSGVNPNLFLPPAERLGVERETRPEKPKQTIDQEFEQYFSMLML